ncbi:Rpn family recombination-promoting nuclease/putative transposase [Flavobacterium sp. SUN046]|uniref:Rpn family recombination-promoting nuclease/putative transposase n=1 Tax=Flavobacterium sp. SUN046 TaxID=3002440 RepID=UPI002DB95A1D|nr:Rpn family recombination-promoting nuclease/putative transposase [Flavobacterium sp. SUN046]MEC4050377.1 Rpn family recombination-promoting nuclease/putative transposase [Flavobacterium sp. SUN046]
MKAKFVNPFIDFGFNKIFGEEASKYIFKDFLNTLLPEEDQISQLTFNSNEFPRAYSYCIDAYCENNRGEKFIIELQKAEQKYYKDRFAFCSCFPIIDYSQRFGWNTNFKKAYCIGLHNFTFKDDANESERNEVIHYVKIKNPDSVQFFEKLTHLYLEIPNFNKTEKELNNRLDLWLYFIKNVEDFETIPTILNDAIFIKAFENTEIAKFNDSETIQFEHSLKVYRDLLAVIEYAFNSGKKEGYKRGFNKSFNEGKIVDKIEIIHKLIAKNYDNQTIAELTNFSLEEIEALRKPK